MSETINRSQSNQYNDLFPIIEIKTITGSSGVELFGFASRNQWKAVIFCTQSTMSESFDKITKLRSFGFDTLVKKCSNKKMKRIFKNYMSKDKEILISKEFSQYCR